MEYCEKHGRYEAREIEIMGRIFKSMCPACEKEQEQAEAEKQKAAELNALLEAYKKRGIEPEYINATLENYIPENESEQCAIEACRCLDSGAVKKVVLLGTNGVGKTHLASALAIKHNGIVITKGTFATKHCIGFDNNGKVVVGEGSDVGANSEIIDSVIPRQSIIEKCSKITGKVED